jgi:hypothetical protein
VLFSGGGVVAGSVAVSGTCSSDGGVGGPFIIELAANAAVMGDGPQRQFGVSDSSAPD